jgi:hypothetical protein
MNTTLPNLTKCYKISVDLSTKQTIIPLPLKNMKDSKKHNWTPLSYLLLLLRSICEKQSEFFGHFIQIRDYPFTSRSLCNLEENPNMNEQFFFCFLAHFWGGYLPKRTH